MSPEILILSGLYDFSTDLVCAELGNRGKSFLRINRETLTDSLISFFPDRPALNYKLKDHAWCIANLKAVWYRQPVFLRNTPGAALSIEEQLDRSQWMAFLRGLTAFDEAKWVNHPQATYLAESKPYQLRCAKKLGFRIPRTIITNDASAVLDGSLGDPIVVKSVDTVLLHDAEEEIFAYTTIVDAKECSTAEFSAIPSTCQELLRPKLDLRVTVIGDRLHCVSITDEGNQIDGDWRLRRKAQLRYDDYILSPQDDRRCRDLVEMLDLDFGAIDLAVTPEGAYFVEINPTGEWAWLESDTRHIAADIVDLLLNRHGK